MQGTGSSLGKPGSMGPGRWSCSPQCLPPPLKKGAHVALQRQTSCCFWEARATKVCTLTVCGQLSVLWRSKSWFTRIIGPRRIKAFQNKTQTPSFQCINTFLGDPTWESLDLHIQLADTDRQFKPALSYREALNISMNSWGNTDFCSLFHLLQLCSLLNCCSRRETGRLQWRWDIHRQGSCQATNHLFGQKTGIPISHSAECVF